MIEAKVTYEFTHSNGLVTTHSVWAGSKEQRKLLDYHSRHHGVVGCREVGYKFLPYVEEAIPASRR